MAKSNSDLEKTKQLMAALGRMPPKQHSEMKVRAKKPKVIGKKTRKKKA